MKMEEYLVLGYKSYDFDNKEGERIAGNNVYYLDLMMADYDANVKGSIPLNTSCTPLVKEQLKVLPGFYKLDFRQKPGAKGKATLVLANAEFMGGVNWDEIYSQAGPNEKKDLKAI